MKLTLIVLTTGKQEGKALPISLPQFLIGRDPQCHLRPASAAISKRHCALIQRDGKVFVRDFDSTNGTFINEQPIKGEVELHHDDKLKVGPLTFGVKIEATTAVNRPTPPPPTKPAPGAKAPTPPQKQPEPTTAGGSSDDESVAAMLLSLQDDSSSGMAALGSGEVPEGSTVMDMVVPPGGAPSTDTDKEKKPSTPASTSNAAKAILEKYMKRPR